MPTFAELLTHYMLEKNFTDTSLAKEVQQLVARQNLKVNCKINREMFYQWRTNTSYPSHKNCLIVWILAKIFELSEREIQTFARAARCNESSLPTNNQPESNQIRYINLSSSKKIFINKLLDSFTLSLHSPIMLLSQHDLLTVERCFYSEIQSRYSSAHFFISLPDYADETTFYEELGKLFRFSICTSNSCSFKKAFINMLREHKTIYFCCISRFGHLEVDIRRKFAALLRSIYTECHGYLHLVLLGGRLLEELRYNDSHSLLNDTIRINWQEWTFEDVQYLYQFYCTTILPEDIAQYFLNITGGHLKLLQTCFSWYQSSNIDVTHFVDRFLKEDTDIKEAFMSLLKTNKNKQSLANLLINEKVTGDTIFIRSELMRTLYWKNLLVCREDGLYWRGEIIRKIGQSIL
jgi:hypothetical protein